LSIKILIVGCNSSIVKKLRLVLGELKYDYVSHSCLKLGALENYRYVFLFSWASGQRETMQLLIDRFPYQKLVFVSTIAVFAFYARNQWNNYPVDKRYFEDYVTERGGAILRLGVVDPEVVSKLAGVVPLTAISDLANTIDNWGHSNNARISQCFSLVIGGCPKGFAIISKILNSASYTLPRYKIFQAPFVVFSRLLGLRHHGYTADALRYFNDEVQIGYGALGSVFDQKQPNNSRLLIVSGGPTIKLLDNGFKNTFIGKGMTGLGRLWHGVHIRRDKRSGNLYKVVPLKVRRRRSPILRTKIINVLSINYKNKIWEINGTDVTGSDVRLFARSLVLAAGPLENVRLLSHIMPIKTSFSDHELAYLGKCEAAEAIRNGSLKKFGPFVMPGKVFRRKTDSNIEFITDVRPFVQADRLSNDFYLADSKSVVLKLMRHFNFNRINEAFFNKFGIGVFTKQCAVYAQALVKNCITFDGYQAYDFELCYSRRRLSQSEWRSISSKLLNDFPNFDLAEKIDSIDAQHILGGKEILDIDTFANLIDREILKIIGSPSKYELDSLHHTQTMINEI
jgi:hypothetical protein